MIRLRFEITGHVQGVFFRKYTVEKAQELNLTGWVCNTVRGSVIGEVQGSAAVVSAFTDWCKTGSPLSQVEHVHITHIPPVAGETGFLIQR